MSNIEEKWEILIEAAKRYYIDSIPTGFLDSEYDELERRALEEDNFSVRDYVFNKYFPKKARYKNSYIEKFKKVKISGSMHEAISEYGPDYYYPLKFDGASLAIYIDSKTGKPMRAVTCGNSSLGYGIDQTWKIMGLDLIPHCFPKGIVAIQCECLIDLDRMGDLDPDRARQKSSGMLNGMKDDILEDVKNLLTLRAYRYYCDDTPDGLAIKNMDYKEVIESLPIAYSKIDGHITFAPADIYTYDFFCANPDFAETDRDKTTTGTFLHDGIVVYNKKGEVVVGLKYQGAGSNTETLTTTTVRSIQWNNQVKKGKDSWSANVIIDPIILHGSKVEKPSAGSVSKMISKNITPGARVSIILANSVIPMVGETFNPGNGDYMWPICSCGYHLSEKDVYGSNLKCGNPLCIERKERMQRYLSTLDNLINMDLNKLLVIDRFKWEDTDIDISILLGFIEEDRKEEFRDYLLSYMKTKLQERNLLLVWEVAYIVLREIFLSNVH